MKFAFLLNPTNYSTKMCNEPNYARLYSQKQQNTAYDAVALYTAVGLHISGYKVRMRSVFIFPTKTFIAALLSH